MSLRRSEATEAICSENARYEIASLPPVARNDKEAEIVEMESKLTTDFWNRLIGYQPSLASVVEENLMTTTHPAKIVVPSEARDPWSLATSEWLLSGMYGGSFVAQHTKWPCSFCMHNAPQDDTIVVDPSFRSIRSHNPMSTFVQFVKFEKFAF